MERISKYKHFRINNIDEGYPQIGFLSQLGLIENEKNGQFKTIVIHEYYKFKFGFNCDRNIEYCDRKDSSFNT